MTEPAEPTPPDYIVKVFTSRGALVFQGKVSQQGDFVHLQKSMYGGVVTLRVHDMMPTLEKPVKLAERMKAEIRPGRKNV